MTYRQIKAILVDMSEKELDQQAIMRIYHPMTEDTVMGLVDNFDVEDNEDDERFEDGQVIIQGTTEGL